MISNMSFKYNKNYDTFCLQNCIHYILFSRQIENAEFYINKSMSIIIEKQSVVDIKYYFNRNCYGVLPQFAKNVKSYLSDANAHDIFQENLQELAKNKEIIVGVDSFYLPYLPFYGISHGLHSIILKGYDESAEKVKVVDWVAPWYYEGYVGLKDFLDSRKSKNEDDGGMFSSIPIKNRWQEVFLKTWDGKLEQLIKDQINLTIKQFYKPSLLEGAVCGIDALAYLYGILRMLESLSEERQGILLDKLHKVLYRLNHRRNFWGDFIDKVPLDYHIPIFEEYAKDIHLLEKLWEKLIYKILMLRMWKRQGLLDDILAQMNTLIKIERESGDKLIEYAKEME